MLVTDACDPEFLWEFYLSQSVDIKIVVICSFHTNPFVIVFDLHTYSCHSVKSTNGNDVILRLRKTHFGGLCSSTLEFYTVLSVPIS